MPKKLTALLAVLLLAGACGDDADTASTVEDNDASGEQLAKEEFLERGDAICGEMEAGMSQVEFAQSQEEFGEYLTGIRGPVEAARERWELLEPPIEGKDVHQAVLGSLSDRLEALNGAITAAESGDTVTAEDLRAEADRAGDEADAEARAYGFAECGKPDPEPVDPAPDDEPQADDQPGDPKL